MIRVPEIGVSPDLLSNSQNSSAPIAPKRMQWLRAHLSRLFQTKKEEWVPASIAVEQLKPMMKELKRRQKILEERYGTQYVSTDGERLERVTKIVDGRFVERLQRVTKIAEGIEERVSPRDEEKYPREESKIERWNESTKSPSPKEPEKSFESFCEDLGIRFENSGAMTTYYG